MAITTALTTQAKLDFLQGVHQPGDVYKLVLIKPGHAGTYDASTTAYAGAGSMADEVATGGGYTQGGITMTGYAAALNGSTAYLDWANITISSATISAVGAMIVNTSRSNKVVSVHDFGATITSTNADFTITIPSSGTGVVRFA